MNIYWLINFEKGYRLVSIMQRVVTSPFVQLLFLSEVINFVK